MRLGGIARRLVLDPPSGSRLGWSWTKEALCGGSLAEIL
jgi:hypothetical protein